MLQFQGKGIFSPMKKAADSAQDWTALSASTSA